MKDKEIAGCLLKVGNQFVCWNSFKSEFFLGKEELSEIFYAMLKFDTEFFPHKVSLFAKKVLNQFPKAKILEKEWIEGYD